MTLEKQTNTMNKVVVLTTGGTIEKSYNEFDGQLENAEPCLVLEMRNRLRLPYLEIVSESLMAKDSLEMTTEDRQTIAKAIDSYQQRQLPIVVLHGTDTMAETASLCHEQLAPPKVPVVFTGAMKPVGFIDTDAWQNLTEAMLAAQILTPGFYIAFHSKIFRLPGVRKNRAKSTFEYTEE